MSKFKLGEILEITSSKRIHAEDYVECGVPFYRSKEVIQLGRGEKITEVLHISQEQYSQIKSKFPVPIIGDILLTSVGTIGIPYYVTKANFYFKDGNLTWFRNFSDCINSKYLLFWMQSDFFKNQINNNNIGAVQKALTIDFLKKFEINLPPNNTQLKIVSVLSSVDSKIELNNRINAELEAMAKTLYDYWFVQFDFPDNKGKPYKTNGGKMVWNEELKREIPEGWETGELKDIANITMGQSPPGESYNEDGEGMIFFQGCTDFGNRFPTVRKFTTQPTRFAKEGDILLSVRAPVGTMNIAKENCCIGRGLAALNSKDNCITYLFGVMSNLKQIFDRRNVDGTTFGSITKDDLFSLNVLKPKKEILKHYHKILNPVFEKQNKIEIENQQLSELRDWLLPMLMNGQVTVGAKERAGYQIKEALDLAAEPE